MTRTLAPAEGVGEGYAILVLCRWTQDGVCIVPVCDELLRQLYCLVVELDCLGRLVQKMLHPTMYHVYFRSQLSHETKKRLSHAALPSELRMRGEKVTRGCKGLLVERWEGCSDVLHREQLKASSVFGQTPRQLHIPFP